MVSSRIAFKHQDALLYRDEYYNRDTLDKGICELLIAKNGNGKTGVIKLGGYRRYRYNY